MGADVEGLLDSAQVAESACANYDHSASNQGLWLGLSLGELATRGRDKLTLSVGPPIESFGLWAEQLVAESTGKHGKGILPVADEPLGEPAAYGDDRVFCRLRDPDRPGDDEDAVAAQLQAIADAGHPTFTLGAHGPEDLGRIFFFAEFATAVAGWVLGINPFDQPNVQEAKDNTGEVLKRYASEGALPEADDADDDALRSLLARAEPPHYVAIMGYLAPSADFDAAVGELRAADPRRDAGHHDVRLRAALPALDRAVPQGRPADGRVPPARPRRRGGRGDPRGRLHVRHAEERAGDRRPPDVAGARPPG